MADSSRAAPRVPSQSLWSATTAAYPRPTLEGAIQTEIAVVGGALSGMATALHLAEAGRQVVVLDGATDIPSATMASGGIVAAQLIRTTPAEVEERLGTVRGENYLRLLAGAARYTFALIEQHQLDCDAQPSGFIAPFTGSAQQRFAQQAVQQWRRYRDDLELLDASATRDLTGSTAYSGAVLDPSGGALNPEAYARALGRRAAQRGASIFGDSAVVSVEHHLGGYLLRTARGEVRARRVVLAANGGNAALHRKLARSVLPLRVCEVATEVLPADMRQMILPQGHALTDMGTDIFTIRYDKSGRLITAIGGVDERDAGQFEKRINRRLQTMLPAWRYTPLEYAWLGTAWLNNDLLPRLVDLDADMIAIQACNGRGVALAGVVGREAARWAMSPQYTPAIPMGPGKRITGYVLAKHLPRLLMNAAAFRDRIFKGTP